MSIEIPPYLQNELRAADELPRLIGDDVPHDVVIKLQLRIRRLVDLVAVRDEQIRRMENGETLCSECKRPTNGEKTHDWCAGFAQHIANGGTLD